MAHPTFWRYPVYHPPWCWSSLIGLKRSVERLVCRVIRLRHNLTLVLHVVRMMWHADKRSAALAIWQRKDSQNYQRGQTYTNTGRQISWGPKDEKFLLKPSPTRAWKTKTCSCSWLFLMLWYLHLMLITKAESNSSGYLSSWRGTTSPTENPLIPHIAVLFVLKPF